MHIFSFIAESQCCMDKVGRRLGYIHNFSYNKLLFFTTEGLGMYILSPITNSYLYDRRPLHVHTFSYNKLLFFTTEGFGMYVISPITDSYFFTGTVHIHTVVYSRVVGKFSKGSYDQ